MIVVIQCAGSKRKHAGLMKTDDERSVSFVAHPELAQQEMVVSLRAPMMCPPRGRRGESGCSHTTQARGTNPLGLLPAFELYENDVYRALVKRYGVDSTFILSAGWGLIPAGFLTPVYDITFSSQDDDYVRRRKPILSRLFMISAGTTEPVVCFGSKDYAPLFAALTRSVKVPKSCSTIRRASRRAGMPAHTIRDADKN